MSDTPAGATDLLNNTSAPPSPAPAPAWQPVGMPITPPAFDAPEAVAARAEIKAKIGDSEFYKSLKAEREQGVSGPASKAWSDLHRAGWPAPQAVTSPSDADAQEVARNEEMRNGFFAAMAPRIALTEQNKQELREGLVNKDLHAWAQDEKSRLIRDANFRRRLLDGDRAAAKDWSIVTLLLGMKPSAGFRFDRVKQQ
jgi:hypothetical protein